MSPLGRRAAALALAGLLAACGGGGTGGTPPPPPPAPSPPSEPSYPVTPALYRVDEAVVPNVPSASGGAVDVWTVSPALPAGIALDPATGALTGTPTVEASQADYLVTASNADGAATVTLPLAVGPALSTTFESLALGFTAEEVLSGLAKPVKIALAPDGRLFFNELDTGRVRVVDAAGALEPVEFATLPVLVSGHRGLVGLALAPDFATSGHLYVAVATPGDATTVDRLRIVRFTDVGGVGTNQTVIVDDLPVSTINDGNDLVFDAGGDLFMSLGDTEVPALAADPASPAGKVLRYTAAGGIPAGNPVAGSPVWCQGLRNTFALAVHPVTDGLFGADNGPATDDLLCFMQPGKDFGWGAPVSVPGPVMGYVIQRWQDVIVPTALAWHGGAGWGAEYADDLFLASYDDQTIRRFEMSGVERTDVDRETVFAVLVTDMLDNKPLDLLVAPDGSLLVSTFTGIHRIRRL